MTERIALLRYFDALTPEQRDELRVFFRGLEPFTLEDWRREMEARTFYYDYVAILLHARMRNLTVVVIRAHDGSFYTIQEEGVVTQRTVYVLHYDEPEIDYEHFVALIPVARENARRCVNRVPFPAAPAPLPPGPPRLAPAPSPPADPRPPPSPPGRTMNDDREMEEDDPVRRFPSLDQIADDIDGVRAEEILFRRRAPRPANVQEVPTAPKPKRPYGKKAREKAIAALTQDLKLQLLRGERPVPPLVDETLSGNRLRKSREDRDRWFEARRRAEQELGMQPPPLPPNRPVPIGNFTPEEVVQAPPTLQARVPARIPAAVPAPTSPLQVQAESSGFVFTFGGQRMMLLEDPRNPPAENITAPTVWTRVCEENQEAREPAEKRQKMSADDDENGMPPVQQRAPAAPPRGSRIATFRDPLGETAEPSSATNAEGNLVATEGSPGSQETTSPVPLVNAPTDSDAEHCCSKCGKTPKTSGPRQQEWTECTVCHSALHTSCVPERRRPQPGEPFLCPACSLEARSRGGRSKK